MCWAFAGVLDIVYVGLLLVLLVDQHTSIPAPTTEPMLVLVVVILLVSIPAVQYTSIQSPTYAGFPGYQNMTSGPPVDRASGRGHLHTGTP